ncbi:hypothetical protein [Bacillus marinisedimentorum]|uniref:nucleotide-binding protein n=1 Tax=Bacillus marinisedimentorum TaxID=1821260 RepID=UPI0007DEAF45|nr:hypothetical protein [Bacillus marinisedimentorum]
MDLLKHNINIFIGHYGVGKTTLAVNLAKQRREQHPDERIALADIDVNNPYFRSRDWAEKFEQRGIDLIIPDKEIAQAEMPFLPKHIYAALKSDGKLLLDVGGYDTGTTVLGSLAGHIKPLDHKVWFVVNTFRPGTETAAEIEEMFQRLQAISRLEITGIINNSNLAQFSTPEQVIESEKIVRTAAENLHLRNFVNSADASFSSALEGKTASPVIPVHRLEHLNW